MARRLTKLENQAWGAVVFLVIVVGLPLYLISKAGDAVGWPVLISGSVALLVGIALYRAARARALEAGRIRRLEERRAALLTKYGGADAVEKIMSGPVRRCTGAHPRMTQDF